MKSVYCAVRTGSLNKAVCASSWHINRLGTLLVAHLFLSQLRPEHSIYSVSHFLFRQNAFLPAWLKNVILMLSSRKISVQMSSVCCIPPTFHDATSYTSQSYNLSPASHYQRKSGHCLGTFRSVNVFSSPIIITVKVVLLNAPHFIFFLFFLFSHRWFQMVNKLREIPAGDLVFI